MIPGYLSQKADEATTRYGFLTEALNSISLRALMAPPGAQEMLMLEARDVASEHLSAELERIPDDLAEVAKIAHRNTLREIASNMSNELTDAALDHLQATGDYLTDEVFAQIARDVATLRRSIRRARFSDELTSIRRGSPVEHSIEEVKRAASVTEFVFHDRASRKWTSKAFIRATYRSAFLSVYNETVLLTLVENGIHSATVAHNDPQAPNHGLIIGVDPDQGLPTYADIRDEIFHPNAHSILRTDPRYVST